MSGTPGAARTARRIAAAAAMGGGGLTALGAAAYGLLLAEALVARRIVGRPHGTDGPPSDGVYGAFGGEPIRMVMLGDSTSVGLGTTDPGETPGVLIACGLAVIAERPVRLTVAGRSGATSADLGDQVDEALRARPEVAVVFVGANDITSQTPPAQAVRHLQKAVRRLREAGAEVIVGTCPDLGTVRPIAQPLRWVTRRWSRQLAAAQTVAVVEAGGRTVAFADLLGPEFDTNPAEMFSLDRYHPSAQGYLQVAYAVLPSVCNALGLWPEPRVRRSESIYLAAVKAAEEPGAEVSATRVAGRATGTYGRWVTLLRRRPGARPDDA
ncbi:lysophospholipase L1-like esterase [Streptosporangium becharense]|uniref:Lysophospholipase L1-like esterase n=1 Tax=Streptosporangium becharense TaxID=1816182 RepID=A0A7W9II10_9ACTN|nr:SGNH/GDSL hydrolase family protein [Streptosporangium becharense]MBB2913387.1 lysophospholipase L1-like esterase [Streptosporangium becharense]MBB5821077.1 lysophospholipase L1-like esterase [Streptosporangium becharense]